jgi:hypothetical protein
MMTSIAVLLLAWVLPLSAAGPLYQTCLASSPCVTVMGLDNGTAVIEEVWFEWMAGSYLNLGAASGADAVIAAAITAGCHIATSVIGPGALVASSGVSESVACVLRTGSSADTAYVTDCGTERVLCGTATVPLYLILATVLVTLAPVWWQAAARTRRRHY